MGSARGKLTSESTRLLDRGLVRYALGNVSEAVSLWEQALEIEPENRRALDYLRSVGALRAADAARAPLTPTGDHVPFEDDGDESPPPFQREVGAAFDDEEAMATELDDTDTDTGVVPDVEILLRNARAEEDSGELETALTYAEEALKREPEHGGAQELATSLRKRLADRYRAELEPLDQIPYLTATDASILELSLDKIGGFLISQIDGEISVDDLLTILSTFDEFRVLSSMHFFLENGIIALRPA